MERDKIIKAFECCILHACNCTDGCPYRGTSGPRSGEQCFIKARNDVYSLIKELTEENELFRRELKSYFENAWTRESDLVKKMQTMIKEECIAGGIWPAFVARVVENVGKKLLEEKE